MDQLEQKFDADIQKELNLLKETLKMEERTEQNLVNMKEKMESAGREKTAEEISNAIQFIELYENLTESLGNELEEVNQLLVNGKDRKAAKVARNGALETAKDLNTRVNEGLHYIMIGSNDLAIEIIEAMSGLDKIDSDLRKFVRNEGLEIN